ncbi:hypothetical protein Cgig2_013629 [Carnegiea gigantea]|uniref:2-hydroxyflavanone C-glucosyltransferase n=1 Tax=Carnegiea gigantea TaxID=171969 RepID=A0A9Q1KCL3_9CARY|nr:hypothetical protein Cgig2_013629 [Carnegiea gigantea]
MACQGSENGDQNGFKNQQVVVVVIPLPAQGHITPILHRSHHIASYQILVHFVGSATHNRQAKVRMHGLDQPNSTNIIFHDLIQLLPLSFPPPTPNGMSTNFPMHLQCLFQALSHLLRHPVSQLLRALSAKFRRVVIVHDSLMASVVQDVESIPNAESYTFHTSSAFTIFFTIWESLVEKPFDLGPNIPKNVSLYKGWACLEFDKFVAKKYKLMSLSSGRLYKTCKALEGKYMDLLTKLPVNENKKLYAIGPITPLKKTSKTRSKTRHWCLDWRDEQEKDSVIYVSFGTTISMNDEQIRELAIGLEKSEQKFIWVLREADKVNIFEEENEGGIRRGRDQLPQGFEDRVRNRRIVVRDWAPQTEILGYPATESMAMGVPIAAWPMHSDQPKNSFLITDVPRVGLVVKDWANHEHDQVVKSSVVENTVRKLMGSSQGKEIRKRAAELGVAVIASTAKGGTSSLELDSFVAYITR